MACTLQSVSYIEFMLVVWRTVVCSLAMSVVGLLSTSQHVSMLSLVTHQSRERPHSAFTTCIMLYSVRVDAIGDCPENLCGLEFRLHCDAFVESSTQSPCLFTHTQHPLHPLLYQQSLYTVMYLLACEPSKCYPVCCSMLAKSA